MALQTCQLRKNGASFQIISYTNNGATSTSNITITNPNGFKCWVTSTTTLNLKVENYDAWTFVQTLGGSNKITQINDIDTSAYTAADCRDLLNALFSSGFDSTLSLMFNAGIGLHLQTSATGANYVAFTDTPNINGIDVINTSGTALEYIRDGAGTSVYLPDNSSRWIGGITNANQISIRRVDVSGTQVTITAEAIRI